MSNRRRTLEPSKATMREIAEACGVSHTSVSFVLRGRTDMGIAAATRQRIFEQAIAADYHPQRNAQIDASKLKVLYLCPDLRSTYADFSLGTNVLVELAEREMENAMSFDMVCFERPRLWECLYRGICENQSDAVVTTRLGLDLVSQIVDVSPVPVLNLGYMEALPCDVVSLDDSEVGEIAARHLWAHGHRRAAVFTVDMPVGTIRAAAFKRYWETMGGSPDDVRTYVGEFTDRSGRALLADFDATPGPRPTAIFAVSDSIAYGVLNSLWEQGRSVPGELSVIGCDDMPYSHLSCPPLTSIRLNTVGMAEAILERLQARCLDEDESEPRAQLLPSTLIERASVGPPSA